MKLAFFADVHLGNHRRQGGVVKASLNQRCRDGLYVLSSACDVAASEDCTGLFVAGDLLDTTTPLPQLLAEVVRCMMGFPGEKHLVVGNHEQVSTAPDDNALASMQFYPEFTAHERASTVRFGEGKDAEYVLCVPSQPGNVREWLPELVNSFAQYLPKRKRSHARVLTIHIGIEDGNTPSYLRGSHDSMSADELGELCLKYEFTHVFAGNWHSAQQWEVKKGRESVRIFQLGALVPTGWDNPGLDGYGGVAVLDGLDVRLEEVPGPRFVREADLGDDPSAFIATAENEEYRIHIDELPQREAERKAASDAAMAARSSETLEAAVAAYVKKMPLPDGVSRKAVLERVKDYLGR